MPAEPEKSVQKQLDAFDQRLGPLEALVGHLLREDKIPIEEIYKQFFGHDFLAAVEHRPTPHGLWCSFPYLSGRSRGRSSTAGAAAAGAAASCARRARGTTGGPGPSRARRRRLAFLKSGRGLRAYGRREETAEPFRGRLRGLFGPGGRVWHRGPGGSRTQLLAAIFCYRALVRYGHRGGDKNGQVSRIVGAL